MNRTQISTLAIILRSWLGFPLMSSKIARLWPLIYGGMLVPVPHPKYVAMSAVALPINHRVFLVCAFDRPLRVASFKFPALSLI